MFKTIAALAAAALLCAATPASAIEINTANAADLDSIKGVGPAMSTRVLVERRKGDYQSWADFMHRIKGIKGARAARLSSEGLTVNGKPFEAAAQDAPKPPPPGV